MRADDPRHGKHAGYQMHKKLGEDACEPCLKANTRYHKKLLLDHAGGRPRKVPIIGTRRRIQALLRLGWPMRALAKHARSSSAVICYILNEQNDTILRSTAESYARTYDELSMRLPAPGSGVTRARKSAERKGYAPPLAWDEGTIDDPNSKPMGHVYDKRSTRTSAQTAEILCRKDIDEAVVSRVLAGEILPTNGPERVEIMRRWLARGGSEAELCRRMGWKSGRYVGRKAQSGDAESNERKAS